MKTLALVAALGFALLIPSVSAKADDAESATSSRSGKISRAAVRAANNQTAVGCNVCFTCGGDWPVFSGMIRSNPNTPTERGSQCGGTLAAGTDSSPYLCCR